MTNLQFQRILSFLAFKDSLKLRNAMRIKAIELINLKSHKNLKIDLSENVNLLVGANNSGKSSIIRSILNLQYQAFTEADIRSQSQYMKILTTITDVSPSDNIAFYNPKHHNEHEKAKGYHIFWHLGLNRKNKVEEYLYVNSTHKVKKIPLNRVKITDKSGSEIAFKEFARFPDMENDVGFIYPFLSKRKSEYFDQSSNKEQAYKDPGRSSEFAIQDSKDYKPITSEI